MINNKKIQKRIQTKVKPLGGDRRPISDSAHIRRSVSAVSSNNAIPKGSPNADIIDDEFLRILERGTQKSDASLDKIDLKNVLGGEVFSSLESQICKAKLDFMRAERRLAILNKLYDAACELINANLVSILVNPENIGKDV
ncbi:MAG: hypothetical protein Q8P20_09605 [bacterium]|nr:hypothetical protein [bacterium]